MKIRRIYAIATVLALAAVTVVPHAAAQSPVAAKADISFEFYAAGKIFPAGAYTLWQPNPSTLQLCNERGRCVFMQTGRELARPKEESWLIFHRYGEVSFLAGAYLAGSSEKLNVPASRVEKEIAKNVSQRSPLAVAAR